MQIVISSTDFDALLSEVRTIVGINGSDVILDKPLVWEHWGKPVYTGVGNTYLPQVKLLLLSLSPVRPNRRVAEREWGGSRACKGQWGLEEDWA